jgi:hypothetical protein
VILLKAPYEYVILKRDKHVVWIVYASTSKRIMDSSITSLKYLPFLEKIPMFLNVGYETVERGRVKGDVNERIQTLRELHGTKLHKYTQER